MKGGHCGQINGQINGGQVIGRGQSKCAIRPGFCGDEVTSLLFAEDASFERETDPALLRRLHEIDPHMSKFVYANKVNCATYNELSPSEKEDVVTCLKHVPERINFFTTKLVDTVFAPHMVPVRFQDQLIQNMRFLHEHGIAHLDLHGFNLGEIKGSPVIFDFGNAILTRDPLMFAEDEHMLERTFAPEAPRKKRRPQESFERREEAVDPRELEEALLGPRVARMRYSSGSDRGAAGAAALGSPRRSPARGLFDSPRKSPRRSPRKSPHKSPRGSPRRSPRHSPRSPSKKSLSGGTRAELQTFYLKAITMVPIRYYLLREYIAKVCNAVSETNNTAEHWQKEWRTPEGHKTMLKLISDFLTHGAERYDPLGLRGL